MGKGGNIAIKIGGFVGWGRARRRFWLTARLSEEEEERQGYELKSGEGVPQLLRPGMLQFTGLQRVGHN